MAWRYLLYTHLYLALAAVALQYYVIASFNLHSVFYARLMLLTGFATFLTYNLPVVFGRSIIRDADRKFWTEQHAGLLRILTVISLSVVLYLFASLRPVYSQRLLMIMIPAGFLALMYSLPIFNSRSMSTGPSKTLMVAGVWTLVTFYLPLALVETEGYGRYNLYAIKHLVFLLALVLPFEIRDIEKDREVGVKTIATMLGEWKVRYLGLSTLLVMLGLSWYLSGLGEALVRDLICVLIAAAYYLLFRRTWSDTKYMLLGDGILFLPLIVYCLFNSCTIF